MNVNMGMIDRSLRLVVALVLLYLALGTTALGGGLMYWLALLVAVVFGVTALVGSCSLYSMLGIRTCPLRR